jgi:rod shape-determining protein MreC
MPLGTLDRAPPPFFRQGPSALSKLVLCAALAFVLMAADHRFALTGPLRNGMATALLPVVRVLSLPMQAWQNSGDYLGGLVAAQQRVSALEARLTQQAAQSLRAEQLAGENARLRELLALRPSLTVQQQAAEVLYEAPDPYSYKLFIDRGSRHGVQDGAPVITEAGVIGQVTRTYLLSSEVTLLVDKDAAIPVLNARTQHRGAAFGAGDGAVMELRFVAAADDVKAGDLMTTSGVDGIYPPGLPVATVRQVDRRGDAGFARISLTPVAGAGGVRHVLVLAPVRSQLPPRDGAPATAGSGSPVPNSAGVGKAATAPGAAAAASASHAPAKGGARP